MPPLSMPTRDYKASDVIRDELRRLGVELFDGTVRGWKCADGREGPMPKLYGNASQGRS